MNHPIDSNVYYLPAPVMPERPAPRVSERTRLSARLRSAWWRLRLAVSEMRTILFRPPQPPITDEYGDFLLGDDDMVPVTRRVALGPAVVIDFEAARLRLRPVSHS